MVLKTIVARGHKSSKTMFLHWKLTRKISSRTFFFELKSSISFLILIRKQWEL